MRSTQRIHCGIQFLACPMLLASTLTAAVFASETGRSGARVQTGGGTEFPWEYRLQLKHEQPLTIEGRVVDTSGAPLEAAHVAVIAEPAYTLFPPIDPYVLGQADTGANGHFDLKVPSLPPYQCQKLWAIARQAGHGLAMEELDSTALQHSVTLRLGPEVPLRGRLVGPDGSPASDVQVHPLRLSPSQDPIVFFAELTFAIPPAGRPSAWLPPVTSDENGEFVLQGVPRSAAPFFHLEFEINDARFGPHHRALIRSGNPDPRAYFTIPSDESQDLVIRLTEPRFVEGVVIAADTKQPIPDAWVAVAMLDSAQTGDAQSRSVWFKADAQGRFRARCRPGPYLTVYVHPPPGTPYPAWVEESSPWPAGAQRHAVTVTVPRGVLVRGRVTEKQSGKSVTGAGVEYQPRTRGNPQYERRIAHQFYWAAEYRRIFTDEEGRFEMAVVPGPGSLLVTAPTPDFVSRFVSRGELQHDEPGGGYYVVEGLAKINPKPGTKTVDLMVPLRRGVTIRGQVIGPNGEKVDRASLLTPAFPHHDDSWHPGRTAWSRAVVDGLFEIRGCDPLEPRRVYILDSERKWGATVDLDPDGATREPPTVGLLPCGSATVRVLDEKGLPYAKLPVEGWPRVGVDLILVEGAVLPNYPQMEFRHVVWPIRESDPRRCRDLFTDADGRVTYLGLIPDAPYRLCVQDDIFLKLEDLDEKEKPFSVEPGQTLNLGEVTVKRP